MADIYDEIINRTFQSTVMGTTPNALEEDTPSVMGLGAPMSGREGTTSQQDVEEDARPASATNAIMDYLQRLAVEYGYNAKTPQAGVRVPATTPTLGTSKMHDIYNTPLYDFMRNNEGGVKDDITVWVRENRDLPSEVLDDYLSGIQDAYDYREREGITRTPGREGLTIIGDRPMTDEELAPLTDTPIEVEELPSGSGLMSRPDATSPRPVLRPETSSNFEDMLIERLIDEEQFKGEAYRATKGEEYLTIGYGHYGKDVKEGDTITQEEALDLLRKDVNDRMPAIRKAIPAFDDLSDTLKVEIAQSWFRGGMSGSPKTIKLINEGKFEEAAEEFLDNDEYRTARERGRAGIIPRMDAVADALRNEA